MATTGGEARGDDARDAPPAGVRAVRPAVEARGRPSPRSSSSSRPRPRRRRRRPPDGEEGLLRPRRRGGRRAADGRRRSRSAARRRSRSAAGEILAVGDPATIDAAYLPKQRIVRTGRRPPPGLRQHAHARGDEPSARPLERPAAHGVAPEVHLPGRGEERLAGVREGGDGPRLPRDDPGRDDDVRRHVLLRVRRRVVGRQGRAPRRPRRDVARLPGAGAREPRGVEDGHARLPREVEGAPARHGGDRTARALHVQPGDAPRREGARRRVRRAAPDARLRDAGRAEADPREVREEPDGVARRDRLPRAAPLDRPRRLALGRRPEAPRASGRSASRTTPSRT